MVKIKRLIIILVFLLPSKLYTQVSLLDKSKEQSWFVFSGAFCGGGSSAYDTCGQGSKLIELGDLDTVNGKEYYEVLISEEPSLIKWTLNGHIREDSNKVYYKHVTWPSEFLIYDFNVKLSSEVTIVIGHSIIELADSITYTVIQTDTIELESIKRRRITLKCHDRGGDEEIWIEGIGSLEGLLYSGYSTAGISGFRNLSCYNEHNITIYKNPDNDFCFYIPTSISKTKISSQFLVYPNPTNRQIVIEGPNNARLLFYDFRGTLLFVKPISNYTILDVSEYPSGFYFYTILQEKQNYCGKIIVDH